MLRSSGVINGTESVFVTPVSLPFGSEVRLSSIETCACEWGAVAGEMAADVNADVSVVSENKDVKVSSPVSETGGGFDGDVNPFAWSDKDSGWQLGAE